MGQICVINGGHKKNTKFRCINSEVWKLRFWNWAANNDERRRYEIFDKSLRSYGCCIYIFGKVRDAQIRDEHHKLLIVNASYYSFRIFLSAMVMT